MPLYSLDLECPLSPHPSVLKAQSLAGKAIGKVVDTLGDGAYLEEVGHWGHVLESCILSLVFPLIPSCHQVSSFIPPYTPWHDVLPHHQPTFMELGNMDWNLWNCEQKKTFLLWVDFFQVILSQLWKDD